MSGANYSLLWLLYLLSTATFTEACDKQGCKMGTAVGKGVCQGTAAGVGIAAATTCATTAWFTFGLSCAVAGAVAGSVATGCGAVAGVVDSACNYCGSNGLGFRDVVNQLDGLEDQMGEGFKQMNELFEGLSENDKKILQGMESFEEGLDQLGGEMKYWFKYLSDDQKKLAEGQAKILLMQNEGFESLEQGLKNLGGSTKKWFDALSDNDRKVLDGQAELIFLQKSGFGSLKETLNHLGGDMDKWFKSLSANDQKLVEGQSKLIFMQKVAGEQLDIIIEKNKNIGKKIDLGAMISLYGRDLIHISNVEEKFSRVKKEGKFGIIKDDLEDPNDGVDIFINLAFHPSDGLESSIDNVFRMMKGGHVLKRESLYELLPQYCQGNAHAFLLMKLNNALALYATAKAMGGNKVRESFLVDFRQNVIKATQAYQKHCPCPKGSCLLKSGMISTLIPTLEKTQKTRGDNLLAISHVTNPVTRNKLLLLHSEKNVEPTERVKRAVEDVTVECVELAILKNMNQEDEDMELFDNEEICASATKNMMNLVTTKELNKELSNMRNKVSEDIKRESATLKSEMAAKDQAVMNSLRSDMTNKDNSLLSSLRSEMTNKDNTLRNSLRSEMASKDNTLLRNLQSEMTRKDNALTNSLKSEMTSKDNNLQSSLRSEVTNKDNALRRELKGLAFDVFRTSSARLKSDGIITYDGVETNTFGRAIKTWNGKFTAPEKGVYRFTFTGTFVAPSGKHGFGHLRLKKDGTRIATSYEDPTSTDNGGYTTITLNTITEMTAGQTVYVEWKGGNGGYLWIDHNFGDLHFTGELIAKT